MTITKYEGARAADGLFEGAGYAEFTSGNKFTGEFRRGEMHGHGEYKWTDGLIYRGDFVNNKIVGSGVGWSEQYSCQFLLPAANAAAGCAQQSHACALFDRCIHGPAELHTAVGC